jgi:hypothetical protein
MTFLFRHKTEERHYDFTQQLYINGSQKMKRSELVNKISEYLKETGYSADISDYNTVHRIVFLAEMEGMLPPAIKVPTTGQEDGEVFELNLLVNEWEPEEKQ